MTSDDIGIILEAAEKALPNWSKNIAWATSKEEALFYAVATPACIKKREHISQDEQGYP